MTTYKPEFEDKLNELGIKEAFERNVGLNTYSYYEPDDSGDWEFFVASAFSWSDSEEGFDYWSRISDL